MSDRDSRLPARAEALLAAFPTPERDFDALAARIDAALTTTAAGSTPDELLEAPFPNEPGEDTEQPPVAVAPRLSDLARAVANKKGDAADADLARETLSVASKLRSQTDVLIERMRAAPRAAEPPLRPNTTAAAQEPALAAPAQPVPAQPAPSALHAPKVTEAERTSAGSESKKPAPRSLIWGGAGLSLAAAMALLVFGRQPEAGAPDTASPVAVTTTPRAAAPEANAERVAPGSRAAQPEPEAASAEAEPVPAEAGDERAVASAPVTGQRAASGMAAKGRRVRAENVVLDEAPASAAPPPKTASKPAPQAVAKSEAAPPSQDAALAPAAGKTDDGFLPDKPSTGAVQAAMASVMNAARACVAGATEATPVTVTFSANGSVKSVVVSGAAQATPAAKCIQAALGRAKVAPFAQPAFSVGVSVRP